MGNKVVAPMGGKIVSVALKQGDAVEVDDEILVMEAMKMEMPIASTHGGVVAELMVSAGDTVEAEQVLLVIE